MVAYGARGLHVDHKRVHPAEKRRYKRVDGVEERVASTLTWGKILGPLIHYSIY